VVRDYIGARDFQSLLRRLGIDKSKTLIFYGDKNNWWAAYSLWVFHLFGFTNTRILDGGRMKWQAEGHPMTGDVPSFPATDYVASPRNDAAIRAFRDDVLKHVSGSLPLVDVRSPQEYSGEKLHMPEYPQEGALRGGHIPGARSVPWARAANSDGTFKSAAELRAIYETEQGLRKDDDVIAYCRIGERSSHTWFVLTHLLGFGNVRNYDGSWTEWGNTVRTPIER
jgi:thiosulfate/3-mercaptopyruvate sulfurtransferase